MYYLKMISQLEGQVSYINQKKSHLILSVSGVGYKIFTNQKNLDNLKIGDFKIFWTYLAVRENSLDLYGFADKKELDFFELLLNVSGIGPKSALNVLSSTDTTTLSKAIIKEDGSYLTKMSGIGKKNADKIVLELKNKIGDIENLEEIEDTKDDSDVIEALMSIGYSQRDATEAVKKIPPEISGINERIKEALKNLN